jgi:hypothetical protein
MKTSIQISPPPPIYKENFDSTQYFIEGLRLHGKIRPFNGNYQQALQTFRKFENDLRQQYAQIWKIEVPLAPTIPKILRSNVGTSTEVNKAAFMVDIFLKHTYPHKRF